MKKPTIAIAWALFAATVAPLLAAGAAPQPYRMAGPSSWVSVIRDIPIDTSKPVEEGESDYLLVDHQVRLEAVTQDYVRFVQRLVNQQAVDDGAQISIDIDPEHERLLLHDVRVIRNGRSIDKLGDARRSLLNREEDLDEGLINGRVTLHVLLQDVRVGDVLDYSYTMERKDPFGERGYHNYFSTQWSSPVRRYQLRVLHRADHPLTVLDHSKLAAPVEVRRGEWIETTWSARDLVAVTSDDHRPSWFYFYPRVEISEFADWNAVRAWSQPMYTLAPRQDAALQSLLAELKSEPDEAARIVRALRFVQDDIRYTGLEIGAGAYRPSQPATVMLRRYGDCKDKVFLLVTLLRAIGVEAYPALVNSEKGRGVAERAPSPGAFDHVIAKVRWKNHDYWLDATASGQGGGLDTLVQADFGLALVLDGSSQGLAPLPTRRGMKPNQFVQETFDFRKGRDKTASFGVKTEYREEEADAMRVKMRSNTASALGKDYLDYYRKSYSGIRMAKPLTVKDDRAANVFTIDESYTIDKPFRKSSKGEWRFHLEAYLVINRTADPEQTERTTPLARAFPMHVRHRTVVYLPGDWEIDDDEVKISDPAFEYRSTVKLAKRRLQLDYDLRNKADFVAADAFRRFAKKLKDVNDDAYYTLIYDESSANPAQTKILTVEVTPRKGPSLEAMLAMVAGLLAGVGAAVGILRLRRRLPAAWPSAPVGIDGWMALPAIGVFLLPFLLLNFIRILIGERGAVSGLQLAELFLLSLLAVPSVTVARLMLKRAHAFPFGFIALQAGFLILLGVDLVLQWEAEFLPRSQIPEVIAHVVAALPCLIGILYMLASQRVRATFVNPPRVVTTG